MVEDLPLSGIQRAGCASCKNHFISIRMAKYYVHISHLCDCVRPHCFAHKHVWTGTATLSYHAVLSKTMHNVRLECRGDSCANLNLIGAFLFRRKRSVLGSMSTCILFAVFLRSTRPYSGSMHFRNSLYNLAYSPLVWPDGTFRKRL